MDIEVQSRSKNIKSYSSNELSPDSLVEELIHELSFDNKLSPYRLRLTRLDNGKQVPLIPHKTFHENGISESSEKIGLFVKDLGPQISWKTVFLVEYFGPFIFHPIFYYIQSLYNTIDFPHTETQQLAFVMVLLHFFKREYETLYIHKFSNSTMPLFNIFKNSTHYWILSGFNLAYFIYSPEYNNGISKYLFHTSNHSSLINYLLFGVWIFAESSNFITHRILSNLRDKDTKNYVIPFGYGFDLVSCPNYFFESVSWLAFALLVNNWSAWVFFLVSSGQMYLWAIKKHQRYLRTFGDDYKKLKRKIYIPFII
ncbi:unnamed protein product [Candida verbasci]|uniref:very-long-chain enoyl-CoA reductase n=1 Tax=Candida verbasci TaxID=1227364 RepID=A0A9W4TY74_9ASCO|nr:unnamed protein product [Candida verbasci]